MNEFPKVAIVAASLDIVGGQGVQARSLIDSLRADGHEVNFVPIDPRFPSPFRELRRFRGVRTIVNQSLYLPSLLRLAAVDVAHVFSASYASFLLAPVPAMAAARALHKRVVLHYHSGEADDHLASWGALVHPWLKLAHAIVVPSAYLREVFARHGYAVRVIPNVVDLSKFVYRERRPLRPRLLSTRNLEPHYRVDVILKAFALLKRDVPDATLTVTGYGSEEARLKRFVDAERLTGVHFAGKVAPDDMPKVYDAADVFLNTSVVDNQPVSILEAFAAGLPVVTTPTGDIASLVRHQETGVIVPPFDPQSLAEAIRWVLTHPDAARRVAGRAYHSTAAFTWPAVRDQWAQVYHAPRHDVAAEPWITHSHSH
jgi:glycosyltransferase involved in cell wall biosynthesis